MSSQVKISAKNIPVGFQTILAGARHAYLADEPIEQEGTDLGFGPGELVLAGLAACKAMTIRFYAKRQGWPLGEVDVVCTMQTTREGGKTLTQIQATVSLTGDLTPEQRTKLTAIADKCPVHKMLSGDFEIEPAVEA